MTQWSGLPASRNGMDTATLLAMLDAVSAQPDLARFQFRAHNRWVSGTRSEGWVTDFYGAGQEHLHRQTNLVIPADQPAVLAGADTGPVPLEYLLNALAACLTSCVVQAATSSGITLTEVDSTVEGDIDLLASLGLPGAGHDGARHIRVALRIKGDATAAQLRALVQRSRAGSPVYGIMTHGVPISLAVTVG